MHAPGTIGESRNPSRLGWMSEQATPGIDGSIKQLRTENDRLRGELAEQHEEILRLRDLLIGKDAELGAARGRLAEVDDSTELYVGFRQQLAARFPQLRRLASPLIGLVRRRPPG